MKINYNKKEWTILKRFTRLDKEAVIVQEAENAVEDVEVTQEVVEYVEAEIWCCSMRCVQGCVGSCFN